MRYCTLIDETKTVKWISKLCWNIDMLKVAFYVQKFIVIFRYQNGALFSSENVIFQL